MPVEIFSSIPIWAIFTSIAATFLIMRSGHTPNVRDGITLVAAGIKFALVLSLYPTIQAGKIIVCPLLSLGDGFHLSLRIDSFGFYFALLASFLWIITSVYSIGYMRKLEEARQTRYFASFALSLSAALGIAFAGDLLTFFCFYELLTLATYPLVVHKETPEALKAGRKYLVYSLSAGALLLGAIAWTYTHTGNLAFQAGGIFNGNPHEALPILFVLFIYGCAVKGSLFPVHAWLPSAMVAPTPVSALLHAVAVVKAGVFGILRVIGYVFGPEFLSEYSIGDWLAPMAGFTIIGASCIALAQDNLKRRLAYSTISQLSYIILGAALFEASAFTGSILHIANHAFMKITLFFCAGILYAYSHKQNISELRGIGYKLPGTMIAFTVAAVSLSGFPPLCGFISKWFLGQGALEADKMWAFIIYLSSAFLNAAYLLPVVFTAFSKSKKNFDFAEKPNSLTVPVWITGLFVLLLGTVPFLMDSQRHLALMAVQSIFGGNS